MFQICAKTPLFSEHNESYKGIAFDGCYYYMAVKGKGKIIKFDKCFKMINTFLTAKIYTSICYDSKERCFWAAASGSFSELFKLDCSFQEIGWISLEPFCGVFSGVSYCCADNSLLASIGEKILHIDKSCPPKICEMIICTGTLIMGVTCLAPCYLYHYMHDFQQIRIVSGDGCVLEECNFPEGYIIEQVLYCGRNGDCDCFKMLTSKQGCYPYIVEAKIEKSIMGKICSCDDKYSIDGCCHSHSSNDCNGHECNSCCDFESSYRSCNDVLESIALVETSVAHILNAEGEKIQKAIASTSCISEILEVNREVVRTIIYVTHLEQVLYNKLDALRECYKRPDTCCADEFCESECENTNNSCSSCE